MPAVSRGGSAKVTLPSDETILIARSFDASREMVWRTWTSPELVRRWWHANRGEIVSIEIDLRVGGRWRYVMTACSGGHEVAFHGNYVEIVPCERLVSTEVYEAFPQGRAQTTLTLSETPGGGTDLEILVRHTRKEHRDMHIQSGMESGLQDALDLADEVARSLA
jgi:uncharacterized protein YndB with AHSA1/START domain